MYIYIHLNAQDVAQELQAYAAEKGSQGELKPWDRLWAFALLRSRINLEALTV